MSRFLSLLPVKRYVETRRQNRNWRGNFWVCTVQAGSRFAIGQFSLPNRVHFCLFHFVSCFSVPGHDTVCLCCSGCKSSCMFIENRVRNSTDTCELFVQMTLLYQRSRKSTRRIVRSMSTLPRNGPGNMQCDESSSQDPMHVSQKKFKLLFHPSACLTSAQLSSTFTFFPLQLYCAARVLGWCVAPVSALSATRFFAGLFLRCAILLTVRFSFRKQIYRFLVKSEVTLCHCVPRS